MDKHHLLRRPAGSSIHGCNICGKEGHRAADCPNGSAVNWVERFGPNWTVDVDAIAAEARREPDYDALAKRAKAYAERKLAELEGGGAGGGGRGGREPGRGGRGGRGEGAERAKDAGGGRRRAQAGGPRGGGLARLLRPTGKAVLPQQRDGADAVDAADGVRRRLVERL